ADMLCQVDGINGRAGAPAGQRYTTCPPLLWGVGETGLKPTVSRMPKIVVCRQRIFDFHPAIPGLRRLPPPDDGSLCSLRVSSSRPSTARHSQAHPGPLGRSTPGLDG